MRKIIDAHCHVYPDKIALKASGATSSFYDMPSLCDGRVDTLKEKAAAAGIGTCMIQSVATTPHQVSSINNFIARTVSENRCFIGLGTLHPDSGDLEGDIEELQELGLVGVKLHPDIQKFKIDDYRCLKIYELCEKKGIPILLHTGDSRFDYSNPNRLVNILEIYDKLTIIGAHFGGWSLWKQAAQMLHSFENFYVDSSSSLYALSKSEALEIISIYGTERILFGSDYPMWEPGEELRKFLALGLPEHDEKKILFENASRLFSLKI